MKLRQNGRELPQPQLIYSKTDHKRIPQQAGDSREGSGGLGQRGVGAGEVREGEARGGAHHQVSNTTPKPPFPLTPHPLHLDPCSGGYHHPPSLPPHRHSTWHTRNRATSAHFWVFDPNPAPQPRVCERAAPPRCVINNLFWINRKSQAGWSST